MGTDKVSIRKEVIVGAVIAVVTVATTWLLGYVDDVARVLMRLAKTLWHFLTSTIELPTGVALLFGFFFLALLVFCVRVIRNVSQNLTDEAEGTHASIDALQFRIFRALAQADGHPLQFERLVHELGVSRLQLSRSLDGLLNSGFVEAESHYLDGHLILLTGKGRDFVLDMKLPR